MTVATQASCSASANTNDVRHERRSTIRMGTGTIGDIGANRKLTGRSLKAHQHRSEQFMLDGDANSNPYNSLYRSSESSAKRGSCCQQKCWGSSGVKLNLASDGPGEHRA